MPISTSAVRTAVLAVVLYSFNLPVLLAQQTGGATPPAQQNLAQSPVFEGTAAISGVVTDANTKQPIPGVMVYLGYQGRGATGRLSRQISDEKGRFVFTDLPGGNLYFLNASKFGYINGYHGTGAGGQLGALIALADGQWFGQGNIVMARPGSITGTVVDERGEPAVGVFVRVLPRVMVAGKLRLAAGQTAQTDDRGVYRLADLAAGRYVIQVPFVQQTIPTAATTAEIAGLSQAQVAAGRTVPDPPAAMDVSENTRVIVGNYFTAPLGPDGRMLVYPPTFSPGVTTLDAATSVDLRPGEDRGGIDVSLRPVSATTVAGTVDGPADAVAGAVVRLLPDGFEALGLGSEIATSLIGGDGRFAFVNIPAGSYTIDLRRAVNELSFRTPLGTTPATLPMTPGVSTASSSGSISSGPNGSTLSTHHAGPFHPYYAQQRIAVDGRAVANVRLTLQRGSTIRGKFVMEGNAPLPPTPGLSNVRAEPVDGNIGGGVSTSNDPAAPLSAQSTGGFMISGISPGQFVLRFVTLPGGILSIVGDDGVDYRTRPFDTTTGRDFNVTITLTARRIDLSGPVTDAQNATTGSAVVLAFPVEREQWSNYGLSPTRIRAIPVSSLGVYRLLSLPAGDYYVVALPPEFSTAWQDSATLAKLAPLATRLTLAWGDVKTQPLQIVTVPR